jgi:hypothetical protein
MDRGSRGGGDWGRWDLNSCPTRWDRGVAGERIVRHEKEVEVKGKMWREVRWC